MLPLVTRRRFAVTAAGLLLPPFALAQPKNELADLDDLMTTFVKENEVPGAALAVTRNGKLAFARGFGFADQDKKTPVLPTSLFRVASVSKTITGIAVMRLVEQKRLKLDDEIAPLLQLKPVASRDQPDPRWKDITVRHCLQHTGGWDRDQSSDPITDPVRIARAVGHAPPVSTTDVIRYMLAQPLDFDPGTRVAYSNFGYLVVGRIIAAKSGMSYEEYVRKEVFARVGVTRPHLGRAVPEKRPTDEVRYYDSKKRTGKCLYPPRYGKVVPLPDGGENFEAFEAFGGWVASAVDLDKLAVAFDDPEHCPLLSADSIADMWARPVGAAGTDPDGKPKPVFDACGWRVRPVGDGGKVNAWHAGRIAGTESLVVRSHDGLCWTVLFNTNENPAGKSLAALIERPLRDALGAVKAWPADDLFPTYLK